MAQTQTAKPALNVPMQPVAQNPVAQPEVQVAQPVEGKSVVKKWWFWVIIVLILLILAGIGAYFFI